MLPHDRCGCGGVKYGVPAPRSPAAASLARRDPAPLPNTRGVRAAPAPAAAGPAPAAEARRLLAADAANGVEPLASVGAPLAAEALGLVRDAMLWRMACWASALG
jgi:hypothetical protein